ncbi:hypothetical protein BBK82_20300 [Lentzea guizhouensis]|uniref:FAD-binding PCMH-type domain-containing protein n=1 Tax=Lentzea guizhouensis TaxID=1586287 RepID=A0A1B2HK08_9PSEU|nr:FAD-dependent oxidoreductase [Lentzea guizhouensis]ANZ38053.1 hypothetical protein BBK82_20300 [Lentzea guizhouensis]
MQIFHLGDPGYDDERSGFQTGLRHEPEVIFAVETAADVEKAVHHAEANGLPYEVQATGHGITTPATGVLISTKRMNEVHVDPATRTATVEAGAVWQQVIDVAAPHGLAPLSGDAPDVGVVGYTLGGGYGLLARELGLASDRVHETTKIGDVVTGLKFELVPVNRVHSGEMYFDAKHAEAVFDAFHHWDLPDHVTPQLATIAFPDLPFLPEPLRGRSTVRLTYASTKPFDIDSLKVAPRLTEQLSVKPFHSASTSELPPHTYQGDNVLLSALPAEALHNVRTTAATADIPIFLGLLPLSKKITSNATHLLKLISPQLDAERHHAAVFDAVRTHVVGKSRNFRFAVR